LGFPGDRKSGVKTEGKKIAVQISQKFEVVGLENKALYMAV
jgi:hypothetical protein